MSDVVFSQQSNGITEPTSAIPLPVYFARMPGQQLQQ